MGKKYKTEEMKKVIKAAQGLEKADIVLKNARYLNVFTNEFMDGDIAVSGGYIAGTGKYSGETEIDMAGRYVVPGFIDAHMHIESSIITPAEYAKAVIPHGTSVIVADPHEIANVLGCTGIDYMMAMSKKLPLDVYFMMSSCVPATMFDESGEKITHKEVKKYLKNKRVLGLAEMMNYPGVISCDDEVLKKIEAAAAQNKIVDGHAPGLSDGKLQAYISAGIYSDHECSESSEAVKKLEGGQWIMIREGTAGKNLEKLLPLLSDKYFRRCMLATDDRHPGELCTDGHIDYIIRKAISLGAKPENVYTAASYNAAQYFGLKKMGAIAPGYEASFVVLDDIEKAAIHYVYKRGVCVSEQGKLTKKCVKMFKKHEKKQADVDNSHVMNTVRMGKLTLSDISTKREYEKVIGVVNGELLTDDCGEAQGISIENDILKLCVAERHHATGHIGVCYVKGYKLKSGAVATSVAHDSHNIIAVGTNDKDILYAIQMIEKMHGGMVVVENENVVEKLELPIAGLMCSLSAKEAGERLAAVKAAAYRLGAGNKIDPFMTLSFTSLPVIPRLRLTSLGVVDVDRFELV